MEDVHEAILEFTGCDYEEPLDLANVVVQYTQLTESENRV